MTPEAEVRIDKWLWAARVFKTRSLAIAACRAGHVKIDGQAVKPARVVRVGEVINARVGTVNRTVKVAGLLHQRVGASALPQFLEDLTPPEEYAQARAQRELPSGFRPKGTGRPTKKDRRLWERLEF